MLSGKDVNVGDIVKMKKAHPCGSDEWEITRTGMDFGMKCCGCGHFVMLARTKFEKAAKAVVKSAAAGHNGKCRENGTSYNDRSKRIDKSCQCS